MSYQAIIINEFILRGFLWPNRTLLFLLSADENYNAGERDYMKALVAQISAAGLRRDTEYLFYKLLSEDKKAAQVAQDNGGDPRVLPATDKEYAAVPFISPDASYRVKNAKNVKIIGAGHSTLDAAVELSSQLQVKAEISYITHMVDDRQCLQKIVDNGVHLFATTTRNKLTEMSPVLAKGVNFTKLDAVPHTNALASCKVEYDKFLRESPNREKVKQIIESGEPFALVVVNAGFEVGPDNVYMPYTEQEARHHGAALGELMANDYFPYKTNLIAMHGGPRNLRDENPSKEKHDFHKSQKTMDVFAEAYYAAQKEFGKEPILVLERFAQGLPYNAIKAGYVMGGLENCVAFVSNSEGYGTMDGAVLLVPNRRKLLGMFPFYAQYQDPTGQRQENIDKYKKAGRLPSGVV
jgi:hypothetical protein